jgi:serine/threonine protein kinase
MNTARLFPSLLAGTRVGRYELLRRVGGGGSGSVWAARVCGISGFQRTVAVKLLHPWLRGNRDVRLALLDEARIAGKIMHPNVVHVFDVGEHELGTYLVMELIDGDTLNELHRSELKAGRKLPVGVVLGILADACAGLHAAHELCDLRGRSLEVVHRDVSLRNLLVTTGGTVKLIDFGTAKARGRLQNETMAGSVKGTLRYMSPEQATGSPVDRRTDVWGIGAVLHALLTGSAPHTGTTAELLLSLRTGTSTTSIDPSIPGPLRSILERTLERDPRRRFQTAHSLREALLGAADALKIKATTTRVAAPYNASVSQRILVRRRQAQASTPILEAAARRRTSSDASLEDEPTQVDRNRPDISEASQP